MNPSANGHTARIEELGRRANACDKRAERQWEKIGEIDLALAVTRNDVDDVEGDVDEIKAIVTSIRDEFRSTRKWLIGATISFSGLTLTAAGLILAVATAGGS